MGLTAHVKARFWESSEAASVSKGTKALAESVDDRWVGSYADTTDRTSKTGALIAAGKSNILGFLTAVGLRAHFGGAWRTIPIEGVDYVRGYADITTNSSGLFAISHPFGINVIAELTHEQADTTPAAYQTGARVKWSVIARDAGQVSFIVWNLFPGGGVTTPQVYANTAFRFHYRIEKL